MKNKFIRSAAACLAAALLLSVPALADTVGGAKVRADALNLRAQASADSASKLLIPNGAFLLVEEDLGDWYKVSYNGETGYVAADYADFSESAEGEYSFTATVSGDYVRLRSGASTFDNILGSYNAGAQFKITGVSGSWLHVEAASGVSGYIRSDYVTYSAADAAAEADALQTQAPQDTGSGIVETAKEYLGYRYVWGGMSTSGFDCSGFVNYVYSLYGYSMNRVAQNIYTNDGTWVAKDQLQPGDLVFFGYSASGVTHVGMYIGGGQFIHASSSAGKVVITDLSENYYTRMYVGAKRIV